MVETILPGTYVTVRDEALISAGRVISGNIGIVGTATKGPVDEVVILGGFSEAKEIFGEVGESETLTLIRALEQIYNNGGNTVYAVRTASAAATGAAYQLKSAADANLAKLQAKTPGTWGNDLLIKVGAADAPSFLRETLPWNAATLHRTKVVKDSGLNNITVVQKSTGLTLRYAIVYDVPPDNTQPQAGINTTTGALTFTTLAGFVPVAADTIIATYEVPTANSRKVELIDQTVKETYTIADASHLASLVNQASTLVFVDSASETAFFNQLPKNTNLNGEKFGTGLSGHTAGNDGADATATDYKDSLAKLENEIVNIVVLAGQDVSNAQMVTALVGHLNTTAEIRRERMAVIGSGSDDVNTIAGHSLDSERLIFVAPGIRVSPQSTLSGAYTAAAIAGLLSALPVQTSPTNKPLNIPGLSAEFSSSQLEKLVTARVLAIEKRDGIRVVKGITTATNSAWHQITTRRIVDFAIYGVRSSCNPYIGKLNNERVRGAMKATLDAFLTRMVQDEALISYELDVFATRAQEIAGEAIVTMTVRPTFSIDFVKVTLYLG
ncbi:MAG: phage tail sheath C-terminal domain-containing protein [Thermosynechococcaceae cyanobacterium]